MAVTFDIKARRVIPNWRDFKRTIQLGELRFKKAEAPSLEISVERALNDWIANKNIGTAADLINCAFISGKHTLPQVEEAIEFVETHKQESSNTLNELIGIIKRAAKGGSNLGKSNSILELRIDNDEDLTSSIVNENLLFRLLHKTRIKTLNEVKNPINWVELARMFSMVGQSSKAEKAILTSLQLAPNNRYVLRSATRFFVHEEKFDKALFYLRKSENIKNDPWLISAHIATSSIAKRYSPFIRDGIRLLNSPTFTNFDLTELASSIGTIELESGSYKKSKLFFDQALLQPNDNSLAQIEWISKEEKRLKINLEKYHEVLNPFEAFAFEYYQLGNWKEAFKNSIKWYIDIPFSKRPVLLGSYIAGNFLKNYDFAIKLCEAGLKSNPDDPLLLNTLLYFLALSGRLESLDTYTKRFEGIDLNQLPIETKISLQATLGLLAFRSNMIEQGKRLYEISIANSERIKNDYLRNLAILNYTRELIQSRDFEKWNYLAVVKNMKTDANHRDLDVLKNEVLKLESQY